MQRQYSGTAGRIENCQIGVFLAYASARGRTLLDRELYLPQVWAEDWERRRGGWGAGECRLSDQAATGPANAEAGAGIRSPLRAGLLEMRSMATTASCGGGWSEREFPTCWPSGSNEKLWVWTDQGLCQVRADRLTSQVDELGWTRCSAGDGAKGPRVYDWAVVEIRPLGEPGKGYWLLARRSIAQPGELAYFVCFGPAGTALEELVRVAGTRWAIEECFEEAKGQVGLDQYEVRRWDGWYRHITLAMLAQAYLSVIKHQAMEPGEKGAATVPMKR